MKATFDKIKAGADKNLYVVKEWKFQEHSRGKGVKTGHLDPKERKGHGMLLCTTAEMKDLVYEVFMKHCGLSFGDEDNTPPFVKCVQGDTRAVCIQYTLYLQITALSPPRLLSQKKELLYLNSVELHTTIYHPLNNFPSKVYTVGIDAGQWEMSGKTGILWEMVAHYLQMPSLEGLEIERDADSERGKDRGEHWKYLVLKCDSDWEETLDRVKSLWGPWGVLKFVKKCPGKKRTRPASTEPPAGVEMMEAEDGPSGTAASQPALKKPKSAEEVAADMHAIKINQ